MLHLCIFSGHLNTRLQVNSGNMFWLTKRKGQLDSSYKIRPPLQIDYLHGCIHYPNFNVPFYRTIVCLNESQSQGDSKFTFLFQKLWSSPFPLLPLEVDCWGQLDSQSRTTYRLLLEQPMNVINAALDSMSQENRPDYSVLSHNNQCWLESGLWWTSWVWEKLH